jgi:arylsulfatase A-like enzyme
MPDRPNVLLVLADQMRSTAMGCAGNDDVATPTLDDIADDGARFTRAYTPDPGCCPARGSLLTGRYPHQHGVVKFNVRLPATAETLGERFRDGGYRTGYVGKWHLDGTAGPGHVPPERRHGFEFWRGFNRGHRYHDGHPRWDDDELYWEEGYQPALQTDHALEFVDDAAASDDPFFGVLSWGPPHTPLDAPDEYRERYDPDALELRPNVPESEDTPELRADLAEYYALVTSLDDQLARLRDGLDDAGVAEDTVVVFTADHGEMLGSHGRYRKGYPHDESVGVPLVVSGPEVAAATHDGPVSLLDLFPTLLSLAGEPVPDTAEGVDLSGVLAGEGGDPHPDGVYLQHDIPFDSAWRALVVEGHVVVVDRDLTVRYLFDLEADPYQRENLAGDPEYAALEERLFERFIAAAKRHGDSTIWSQWYMSEALGNDIDGEGDVFGDYADLPGERPRYE